MRQNAVWGGVVALPLATLVILLGGFLPDPTWSGPRFHFIVVSLTALLALGIALLMVRAATQLRDVRVFFLSLTYLSIAGIFLVHALTTPGALVVGNNPWVGFSAWASLASGAFFFALTTVPWSTAQQRAIIARQHLLIGAFLLALAVYGAVAVTDSLRSDGPVVNHAAHSDDGYLPVAGVAASRFALLANPIVGKIAALVTLTLLALVIVRYRATYCRAASPLVAALLVSAIFLAQAQISMALTAVWHASWWEYHVLMLAAFGTTVFGLVQEYADAGSVHGVIEGLLLRDTITQVQRGYTDVIVALVEAVEAKDHYTRGHTQRVAELALAIGRELRLSSEQLRILNRAALLHDIGKIGVPDAILNKPGRLTDEEFAVIKEHPGRGYTMIANIRSLHAELGGIRSHHERLDGSGYPDGLTGDAIPLLARIIAVGDVFDALTSPRPYRGPWSHEQALALIDAGAGTEFDPTVVAALHHSLRAAPTMQQDESSADWRASEIGASVPKGYRVSNNRRMKRKSVRV
jgi:HD-GYP domain-containing protein (c-di-GMP phosphodiesterase class II)